VSVIWCVFLDEIHTKKNPTKMEQHVYQVFLSEAKKTRLNRGEESVEVLLVHIIVPLIPIAFNVIKNFVTEKKQEQRRLLQKIITMYIDDHIHDDGERKEALKDLNEWMEVHMPKPSCWCF
jgi:hypothetical protein